MKLFTYFKSQKVLSVEMREQPEAAEAADRLIVDDNELFGVIAGLGVTVDAPPSRDVFVGNGLAYCANGARAEIPAGTVIVDTTVDVNSDPTELVNPGWFKWLSIFIRQDRAFSVPRIDGDNNTIQYHNDEFYEVYLLQGTEAAVTPTPPALQADSVLLCDILVTQGQTDIDNGDISLARRQDVVRIAKTNVDIVEGSVRGGLDTLAGYVSDIISGAINIVSQFVLYTPVGGTNWADGTSISALNVRDGLDETRTDLASTTNAIGGTRKIGAETFTTGGLIATPAGTLFSQLVALADSMGIFNDVTTSTFKDGQTVPASSVWEAIDTIVNRLGAAVDASNSGATRIGSFALGNFTTGSVRDWFQQLANSTGTDRVGGAAIAQSPTSISAGNILAQLTELLTAVNARALKAGDTFSGLVTLAAGGLLSAGQLFDVHTGAAINFASSGLISGTPTVTGPIVFAGTMRQNNRYIPRPPTAFADADQNVTINDGDIIQTAVPAANRVYSMIKTGVGNVPEDGEEVTIIRPATGAGTVSIRRDGSANDIVVLAASTWASATVYYDNSEWRLKTCTAGGTPGTEAF